jgi:hypothetical protein
MEEFIKGYQWSPETKQYMGEYVFPNNGDKEKIHMPPFTTLISPPICEKGYTSYWNGNEWNIDVDPSVLTPHPPIDDYYMLMSDYIEYLKENDLWTPEDEIKRQEALQNAENEKLEAIRKREEDLLIWERDRDYSAELREIRDQLLVSSDWTQLPDVQSTFTSSKKEEWIEYRQKLRDLTENIEDPKSLVFGSQYFPRHKLDPNHPDWPIIPK